MVQPWPENPEFEFRDISYSDKHVAVYHGWLPLYAIASSFRLFGITPSPANLTHPIYNAAERRRRTIAARAPSVLFGALGIIGFYLAGRRLQDSGTGIIAALLGTFLAANIFYSQMARYYAPTAAGLTFTMWSILAMRQSARWRDYLLGAVLFSLLFYTHLLSFAVACAMWAIVMASLLPRWRTVWLKAVAFSLILLVTCVPWLIGTGFLRLNGRIPRAWTLMSLGDLLIGRFIFSEFGALLALGLLLASASLAFKNRLPDRAAKVFGRDRNRFAFVSLWFVVTFIVFFFNIPAASFFLGRLELLLTPPSLLLIAMVFRSGGAVLSQRRPLLVGVAGAVVFILVSNQLHPHTVRRARLTTLLAADRLDPMHDIDSAVEYLRRARVDSSTRIFASPDMQFDLTFYTGMFVQSILPVRKSFLDTYPGDIVLFIKQAFWRTGPLRPDLLRTAARNAGRSIDAEQALNLSCRLSSREFRSGELAHVVRVEPPVEPVPPFAETLWEQQRQSSHEWLREELKKGFPRQFILLKNFEPETSSDWWFTFYYALVNPKQRQAHPNFEDRLHNATLTVLPCADVAVYYSSAPVDGGE